MLKQTWLWIVGVVLAIGLKTQAQVFKDAQASIDARVHDLLGRMTPEEKFWQLFMLADNLDDGARRYTQGAFGLQFGMADDSIDVVRRVNEVQRHFVEQTRLGIPIIPFAEGLHGLVQKGATSFPQGIGLAATFDTNLMHDVSRAIAEECRDRGIRQVLSPVVNIASDVRWGRTEETYGEDPLVSSLMGVAFVSEFEKLGIVTTPKHFIANVGDGGRDSYPISVNERALKELYLPPFQDCIARGGSRSIMTSYNSLDGSPCSANDWLNNKLLKDGGKFSGFVVSDAGAVGGANVLHFTAKDYAEAGQRALTSGLDVIFQTSYDHYKLFLPPFLDGRIPVGVIDSAVARVLRVKFALGLFEQPYVTPDSTAWRSRLQKHRAVALRAAEKSIVLLKNDRNLLPLSRQIKNIAVVGPDATEARLGGYSSSGNDKVSILDAIKSELGSTVAVRYVRGCERTLEEFVTVPSSNLTCARGDSTVQGLLGEYFSNIGLDGASAFTRADPQIQFQWTLFSPDPAKLPYDFYSVRWQGTLTAPASGLFKIGIDGNDGYRLYLDDSLVIDNWQKVTRRTRVTDYRFEVGHKYRIRLEYFEPTGNAVFRLVWNVGVPADSSSLLDEAVALASHSDAVIAAVGIEEGEFRDRASLRLPGRQEELVTRLAATGKPLVVVLVSGSAVTMNDWLDRVPALLDVWYPGEVGGEAVADVLFGDVNPAGRLPITFPVAEGQLPLMYNHKPTGRGDDYADLTGQPLFPFGYGLSYTHFDYSDLKINNTLLSANESTFVTCKVTNAGTRAGDEVVQLYVHDEIASVARPVMELKGFRRIHLEPGETIEVPFLITPATLSMLNQQLRQAVEPGDFRIMIGSSSKDIRLRGILTVKG
jgi:beta-glucosidase